MKRYIILTGMLTAAFTSLLNNTKAQADWKQDIKLVGITSSHTAFPDAKRADGYTYDGKFFDAASHYSDSSVLILVPKRLPKQDHINLIFWFHGWNNNIDTAMAFFHLAEQFSNASRNAVLVLAETARNAPDSYAGKLEQTNVFAGLVNDVLNTLKEKKDISKTCQPGNIILAGHSGAYRAIAYILQNGGVPVQEVELFDALYSNVDKFTAWLQKDSANRFIHWYTNHGGGTDEVSVQMMEELKKENIPFALIEEKDASLPLLQSGRVLFVHSAREHNEIINNPDNFKLLLVSSSKLSSLRK
jgi:hypothetical protein